MVEGGAVSININGEVGPYFKSYKGLRQGDLTSSFKFGGGHRKGGHSSVRQFFVRPDRGTCSDCSGL